MRIVAIIALLAGTALGQVTFTPHLNLGKPPYQYPHYETILNPNFDILDNMVPASSCLTDGTQAANWDGIAKQFTCQTITIATATNCAAAGTAANPSVVSCSSAKAGSFSCATNASTGT